MQGTDWVRTREHVKVMVAYQSQVGIINDNNTELLIKNILVLDLQYNVIE